MVRVVKSVPLLVAPSWVHGWGFLNHKLNPAEQHWWCNWKLLSMKSALEQWRHWLEGAKHPFLVLTYHKNLEYLLSAERLNPRQAKWALFFTWFNFTFTYCPGSKNTKEDTLSCHHEYLTPIKTEETIIPSTLVITPVQWDLLTELGQSSYQEPSLPECPPYKTFVPQDLCNIVIEHINSSPSSGHPRITATLHLLLNQFWWPAMVLNHHRLCHRPLEVQW